MNRKLWMASAALAALAAFAAMAAEVSHLRLTSAEGESEYPSLAWTGSNMGVAWMDGRDGNQEIYFRLFDMASDKPAPALRLTESATWDDHPKLCWTGSEFAISWVHERNSSFDLMFQTLDAGGGAKSKPRRVISGAMLGKDTAICPTGAGYGVIVTEMTGAEGNLVYRYLDAEGKVQGDAVPLTAGAGRKVIGSFIRAGSDFALFYLDSVSDSAYMLMLDPFGKPRGAPAKLNKDDSPCGVPAADASDRYVVAAWPSGKDVKAQLISLTGDPIGTPYTITSPLNEVLACSVGGSRNGFAVAWVETGEEGRAVNVRRLDQEGKPLDQATQLTKPRPSKVVSHALAVAADNDGFVVVRAEVVPRVNTELVASKIGF